MLALIFMGLYVIRMGCNYYMGYQGHVVGTAMEKDMRTDLFKHIQTLPFQYYDENRTGQIMSRLMGDLREVGKWRIMAPKISLSPLY